MILIVRRPASPEQLTQMEQAFGDALIKLAVDVEREILAGGGELHADCEEALPRDGTQQSDVWGGDWFPRDHQVGYESLINIRPRQGNFAREIQDQTLRSRVKVIVRACWKLSDG